MNKKLFLLIFIPVFFLFACTSLKNGDLKDINKELDFDLEKVQLTKSFQQIEPFAKFTGNQHKDKKHLSLLISAGLLESSGIKVDKIVRENNNLNIYIENIVDTDSQIAVPQAIVLIDSKEFNNTEQLQFNVIGENLSPINIKILYNDLISLVDSQFNLSSITSPQVSLQKEDDDFVWSLNYGQAFDKSSKDLDLISFNAYVDANSGKINSFDKKLISKPLDRGNIVGFYGDRYLVYKILSNLKDQTKEELWAYDSVLKEKTLLFTSSLQTGNLHFSPNNKFLSFIESGDSISNLYIMPDNKKAYRVSIREDINPISHTWIDNNTIGLVENKKNTSYLYTLDIRNNEIKNLANLSTPISNISVLEASYLYSENISTEINNDIYITNDFNDFSLIGSGYNAKFLNKNTVVHMESRENKEETTIHFHDLRTNEELDSISGLIPDFQILDDYNILYSEKMEGINNYILKKYNISSKETLEIMKTTTPKVYFNKRQRSYFINLSSPIENDSNMLIYTIKP